MHTGHAQLTSLTCPPDHQNNASNTCCLQLHFMLLPSRAASKVSVINHGASGMHGFMGLLGSSATSPANCSAVPMGHSHLLAAVIPPPSHKAWQAALTHQSRLCEQLASLPLLNHLTDQWHLVRALATVAFCTYCRMHCCHVCILYRNRC